MASGWIAGAFWLVYASRATGKPGATSRDIYGTQQGLDSTSIPLVSSAFDEGRPSISPDGRWLLYESDATGVPEVYVGPFPNSAASLGSFLHSLACMTGTSRPMGSALS